MPLSQTCCLSLPGRMHVCQTRWRFSALSVLFVYVGSVVVCDIVCSFAADSPSLSSSVPKTYKARDSSEFQRSASQQQQHSQGMPPGQANQALLDAGCVPTTNQARSRSQMNSQPRYTQQRPYSGGGGRLDNNRGRGTMRGMLLAGCHRPGWACFLDLIVIPFGCAIVSTTAATFFVLITVFCL